MATNQVVLLKDLKARKNNMTVKVKIASLWRLKMNGTENQTYRMDMILMDDVGSFIYANCHHRFLERFQELLSVDGKIYITNPFIAKDDSKQYVDNDLKLSINDKTTMEKCLDWEGPKFAFNFVDFKIVNQKTLKHATKIDFIGCVKVCYNLGYVDKKNGLKSPKINFKLRNLDGVEVHACLWEDKAIALSSYMSKEDRDPYVFVLVQFGAINNYHGNMSVQNRFEASRLFINEDIEELTSFKNKYLQKFAEKDSSESSNSTTASYMISNVEDEFLNNTPFTPIVFIPSRRTESKVIIVGKITEIGTDLKWYYKGCSYCRAKVEKKFVSYERDDGTIGGKEVFKCSYRKCEGGDDIKEVIRYRISLKVDDGSGTITMTLFDYEAAKMFGKPAKHFFDEEEEMIYKDQVPPSYPKQFDEIVGKKFGFIINVTPYNIEHPNSSQYGISMLTKDEALLAKLNKKWNVEEVQARFLIDGGRNPDLEDNNIEDNMSSTDPKESEVLPLKNVTIEQDASLSNNTEDDVYEVDGPSTIAATKRKRLNDEDDGTKNKKFQLLIPKIEK